ncbi:hypothetical protein CsSME_00051128 [Camellia sinensis var. sinensis]
MYRQLLFSYIYVNATCLLKCLLLLRRLCTSCVPSVFCTEWCDQARGRIMMKFADLIDENAEELAALDTIDAGKLFSLGKSPDIALSSGILRYYAGAADKIHGETLKMSGELQAYTLREPIGVVGHIIPWNFPSSIFFMNVSPALASGCTMVVKPAEQTPLSALYYAHLAKQAGIPNGVLNVITGFGPTAGAAIASHMDIDKVSFTGSTEVGRLVMQAAATSNLKHISLELGGKSPLIIFDDADVDKAADLALVGVLYNKAECLIFFSHFPQHLKILLFPSQTHHISSHTCLFAG